MTSKRLNALQPPPSPSLPPSSLNITNESAITRTTDEDDENHHHHHHSVGTANSDEMDILATNTTQKSRSIENTTENIEKMCINPKLSDRNFMIEFEVAWLPQPNLSLTDSSINVAAADDDTKTRKSQQQQQQQNNCTKLHSDSVKLYKKPFRICVISEFLENGSFTRQLVNEMCHMEWQRKQMDLYEFHQTTDLANLAATTAKPALKQFYSLLTNKMLPWMREITGLSLTRVSASCSMYNYGDYLLVHDDLLSDRQIAFVFYLSPWYSEWTEQMGGALELFETDRRTGQPKYPIVEKFPPRNNQFVFFHVCKESFHQVGEVTNSVYPRLTINGWFHGTEPNHTRLLDISNPIAELIDFDCGDTSMKVNIGVRKTALSAAAADEEYHAAAQDDLDLNDWISSYYLKKRVKQGIQQQIEVSSETALEKFLIAEFFDTLSTEFKSPDLNWILEGPANQRKYERLHFARNSTGPLKDLYTLFTSASMFELLQEYTELDLSGLNADHPTCSVQLCRFTQGCYTLLGDSTTFADSALDVILFFNARDGVGKVTYLSPSAGGISTEYNTTAETDITTATTNTTANNTFTSSYAMDQSSIAVSDISSSSSITVVKQNASNKKQQNKNKQKNASHSANSSTSPQRMDTSDDDDDDEDDDSLDEIQATSTKPTKSSNQSTGKNNACKVTVRADVHEHKSQSDSENDDIDSSMNEGGGGGNGGGSSSSNVHRNVSDNENSDDDEDDDAENEELAQEDALLTIHPKNNSLNLVYRLSGQTKFVKYISKNSLKSDEYIYILFASYKE